MAGPDESTSIVANYLDARFRDVIVITETSPPRVPMAVRRARRVGWGNATGQVLFITVAQPVLRWASRRRRKGIREEASIDASPRRPDYEVSSVNDQRTVELLTELRPSVVVVFGTRIIASLVLETLDCPVMNMHAGITPQYRGVHGGYWALAERHPEWVGTTVHLVDPGIDTGGILAQASFTVTDEDSIATYPDLHLVNGLPLLAAQVSRVLEECALEPVSSGIASGPSMLRYHPTLWGYLRRRWSTGVR